MEVQYGAPENIGPWMELVSSIRSVFPGLETGAALEDHKNTVLRFMKEGRALCVMDADGLAGVLLLSKKRNMICCLGVEGSHRGKGVGSLLLEKALSILDRSRPIEVTTYRANDEKGTAARKQYKKFGFQEMELVTEYGYPLQRSVLKEIS